MTLPVTAGLTMRTGARGGACARPAHDVAADRPDQWVAQERRVEHGGVGAEHRQVERRARVSARAGRGQWLLSRPCPCICTHLACASALPQVVSWVPMDTVAAAAAETLFAAEAPALVNISHPRPITWRAALSAVNKELAPALPFVPLDAWVHALTDAAQEAAAEQLETIVRRSCTVCAPCADVFCFVVCAVQPGIKLLEYFRSLAVLEAEAREQRVGAYEIEVGGLPVFATAQAERVSPSLAALPPLGEQDARAWVRYWKSRRFIE